MNPNLIIEENLNLKQIFNIYKFEIFLQRKRYILVVLLSIVAVILTALISLSIPTAKIFCGSTLSQIGSFSYLLTLFFAGGIIANEFDKKTALTNFTKTGRDNFFIGKTFAAFTSVLTWIAPASIVTSIFCLIKYNTIPIELVIWFGYYCLIGISCTSLYLLCSAIFKSGSQAMIIGFIIFTSSAIVFAILLFIDPSIPNPTFFYLEMVGQAIFVSEAAMPEMNVDLILAISIALLYLIPCLILSYIRFKTRDV
ncbi:MAG: ABC transporter permease [Promethearchaeota archaeon]